MALHDDLLNQARLLIYKEPRKPKQASLKRGVSAAYYALFHLLVDEASRMLISGAKQRALRELVKRAFVHGVMKEASKAFEKERAPVQLRAVLPGTPSKALRDVAKTFGDLQ